MGQLMNLEGTDGPIHCEFFKSVMDIKPILKRGLAATSANTNGAINIWIDKSGCYRGSLLRHQQTLCSIMSVEFSDVRTLCKQWLKMIQ